jgi:hypothetical protein
MGDTRKSLLESLRNNGELDEYMKYALKEDDLEFELIYGDVKDKRTHLTKQQFMNLRQALSSDTMYTNLGEVNSLDIKTELRKGPKTFPSSMRLTIEGLDQIKQYCKSEMLDTLSYTIINKKRYKDPKHPSTKFDAIHSGDYPCRVNLKEEIPQVNTRESGVFVKDWSKKNKSFRYKKRFSFLTLDKMWRVDITAIKQTRASEYFKTFKQSKVLSTKEIFELEVEYVGNVVEQFSFEDPPILEYARVTKEARNEYSDPFGMGVGTFSDDTGLSINGDMNDLYLSEPTHMSPRYTEVEYDEQLVPKQAEYTLPSSVRLKGDFWKYTDNDDVLTQIKKISWDHPGFIYIPRKTDYQENMLYVVVEISPHVFIEEDQGTREVSELIVPVDYIIEDIQHPGHSDFGHSDYEPDSPDFHPSSESPDFHSPQTWIPEPVVRPVSPTGSGNHPPQTWIPEPVVRPVTPALSANPAQYKVKSSKKSKKKGSGKLFSIIDSSVYTKSVIDQLVQDLQTIVMTCFHIIYETPYFLPKSDETRIIKHYCKVTGQSYTPKWSFVGPQPVSMGVQHLNPYNPHAIVSGYAVTEKADGMRAELIIKDGRGYLLTPKKKVIDTGTDFETTDDWIFDGEYITHNKQGESIRLFMIFDVYYSSQSSLKEQPHTYPWYAKKGASRSSIIHEFKHNVDIVSTETSTRIGYKQYYEGPDKLVEKNGQFKHLSTILKQAKKILDKEDTLGGFEYCTDGLIFIPMFLPVKGTTEGERVKHINGTWYQNYKWKPPEENTIDFKVIYGKGGPAVHTYNHVAEDGRKEIRSYQKIHVAVGYKEKDDMSLDFTWALLTHKPSNKQNFQYFDPPEYNVDNIHITNIPLQNGKMICEKDKRSIEDGQIVEMRYVPDAENGYRWVPLRIRDDKHYPQYFKTANNIWNTINNPVTPSMIKGVVDFKELQSQVSTADAEQSQEYYVDTYEAEDTPIRDLHNYIKSKLIARIGSSPDIKGSLMIADLSCGRGGDIQKYLSIQNNIDFILGLDIASNVNEAAQRYYYQSGSTPKALFLQYDTSKSIMNKQGCLGATELCETMIDMIFHKSASAPAKYKQIQTEYAGIAKPKFDIVSSQFSIHYYFQNETTLRGFCENVRDLCSSGGYFIGTCYDGMKVFDMFRQTQDPDAEGNKGKGIEKGTVEMKDDSGHLIYQIKQLYEIDDFTYQEHSLLNDGVMERMLGNEIEVFMSSIGQPIVEYLVHFSFFIDMMKEYGFDVVKLPSPRKGEYNPIREPIASFDTFINNVDDIKDNDHGFVKKTRNTDLYKVASHKGYARLSGLNNYFVFQKQ